MLHHPYAPRRIRVVAIVVGLLVATQLILAASAPAAGHTSATAAQGIRPIELKVGITSDQLDQLRSGSSGASPRTQSPSRPAALDPRAARPALSLTEGEATSERLAASSSSTAGAMAVPPIGEEPNGEEAHDCFAGDGVDGDIGRVHNRFTYCLRLPVTANYWEIDNHGVPIEKEGTTTATLEVFAQGDNTERRVRVWARIQKDSVDYDWGPIDNIFVAPNVPLSIIGQCFTSSDVCHATRGAATMPWVVWDNNSDWFYWDVYNHEESGEGRDKISYNHWLVELFTDDAQYKTLVRGRSRPRLVRCDSAAYFQQGTATYPKACVFSEVIPHLTYTLDSDVRSVAFHIFTAQYHPNDTYPLLVPFGVPMPRDKRIPGRYIAGDPDAPGLHRITPTLHPGEYKANGDHKDGACYKRGPHRDEYLDTGLPVPPRTPDEQCDEYPFASTLEGAANPFWDFSVKAVPQRDNSIAGARLANYYVDDRILAWDPGLDRPDETNDRFYVEIK